MLCRAQGHVDRGGGALAGSRSRLRSRGLIRGARLHGCWPAALLLVALACARAPTAPDPAAAPDARAGSPADPDTGSPRLQEADLGLADGERSAADREEAEARFAAAAAYSRDHGGVSLLVIEGGAVTFEVGQNGHPAEAPRPIFGATRSFWGVVGAAADSDGLLDLDERVSRTLPEFDAPWSRDIRVRQLLDFTSGLESGLSLAGDSEDRFAAALTLESIAPPGERFHYGPGQLFAFGELLRRKLEPTGEDPLGYLQRRILEPIGLEVSAWARDPAGRPDMASGATLTPRNWAKFGQLLVGGGRFADVQVLEERALAECLEGSEANPGYGLGLWLNRPATGSTLEASWTGEENPLYPGGPQDLVMAAGEGNQRLYAVPSLGLVAVRFGEPDRRWRDDSFLARLIGGAPAPSP